MASTAKTPIRYYGDAEHPRETVDPETGICTWKAGVMESRIEMDNLQHAQARAEAYHAGDRSREIDNISKGYLLAKYPLVKEYQRWEQGSPCFSSYRMQRDWLTLGKSALLGRDL